MMEGVNLNVEAGGTVVLRKLLDL